MDPKQINTIVNLVTDKNFSSLHSRAQGINFFEISKMKTQEIKHSATIAWLMRPLENHGLGNTFIQKFLVKLWERNKDSFPAEKVVDKKNISLLNLLTSNAVDLQVLTEYSISTDQADGRIDILATSKENKFALCIENKVLSGFHSKQLDNYYNYIEKDDPALKDLSKFYVVLSPNENRLSQEEAKQAGPEHYEEWLQISYGDIVEILKDIRETKDINQKVKIIISDYIDCLANNQVVEDNELNKKLENVNKNHRDALNLIFGKEEDGQLTNIKTIYADTLNLIKNYRNDSKTHFNDNCKKILEELKNEYGIDYLGVQKEYCGISRLQITTSDMDRCLHPEDSKRGTFKNGKKYTYYIYRDNASKKPNTDSKILKVDFYLTPEGFGEAVIEEMNRFIDNAKKIEKRIIQKVKNTDMARTIKTLESDRPLNIENKKELEEALKDMLKEIKDWQEKILSAVEVPRESV